MLIPWRLVLLKKCEASRPSCKRCIIREIPQVDSQHQLHLCLFLVPVVEILVEQLKARIKDGAEWYECSFGALEIVDAICVQAQPSRWKKGPDLTSFVLAERSPVPWLIS